MKGWPTAVFRLSNGFTTAGFVFGTKNVKVKNTVYKLLVATTLKECVPRSVPVGVPKNYLLLGSKTNQAGNAVSSA